MINVMEITRTCCRSIWRGGRKELPLTLGAQRLDRERYSSPTYRVQIYDRINNIYYIYNIYIIIIISSNIMCILTHAFTHGQPCADVAQASARDKALSLGCAKLYLRDQTENGNFRKEEKKKKKDI